MDARHPRSVYAALIATFFAAIAFSTAAQTQNCGAVPVPEVVLQRLNSLRQHGMACQKAGLNATAVPLRWNPELAAVAAAQARDMALRGSMAHRDRDNRNLGGRLAAYGYRFKSAAENLGFGYESVDEVVDAWLVSEPHCVNLMNAGLVEVGLACSDSVAAKLPGEGRYWAMVFGTPPRADAFASDETGARNNPGSLARLTPP